MEPRPERLVMWGQPSQAQPLDWSWVAEELATAGTYWVVARSERDPHPRPVWGTWTEDSLFLSIGSPVIARHLAERPEVSVHLDSGVDVVILDGRVVGASEDAAVIRRYNEKYDWDYTIEQYGPLTRIVPSAVVAWQSAGWAGRDGVQRAQRWRFDRRPESS